MMRVLLVGHGKMGQLVGDLAGQYGCEVGGRDRSAVAAPRRRPDAERWAGVDVAIDFSTADVGDDQRCRRSRAAGINLVVGTTGWSQHEAALRQAVDRRRHRHRRRAEFLDRRRAVRRDRRAAPRSCSRAQPDFGAFLHEAHHAAKKDAPSGTALLLKRSMEQAGFPRPIDVSSTRAGFIPGTHTIGFDGPAETITLTHTARDRTAFARGALTAAKWVQGKRGWFTMQDVLGIA